MRAFILVSVISCALGSNCLAAVRDAEANTLVESLALRAAERVKAGALAESEELLVEALRVSERHPESIGPLLVALNLLGSVRNDLGDYF